jgi:hypothetical protein
VRGSCSHDLWPSCMRSRIYREVPQTDFRGPPEREVGSSRKDSGRVAAVRGKMVSDLLQ